MHNDHLCHFDFEKSMPSSIKRAADWAWTCLERLSSSFCSSFCQPETKCELQHHLKASHNIEFEEAQKTFHQALAYLPVIDVANDECPACLVTNALKTFPLIASKSEIAPVSELKMNGVDCYPEVVPMGLDTKRSFPCCVINTWIGDSEHEIENQCREMALLNLDLDELPSMPPWEYENIEHAFLPGQAVVKRLWAIKQGEPEEEVKKSELFRHNLTNAVAATICLRDLVRIKCFYPDAIPEGDFDSLMDSLTEWINCSVEKEPLLKKISDELFKIETSEASSYLDSLSAFYSVMLLHHPDMPLIDSDPGKTKDTISKIMNKCIEESLQPIKDAGEYVINAKLKSCIYPTPEGQQQYRSTSRYFMMLREYWMLCQRAITDRTCHHVAWHPYPLSTLVTNLKHRIDTCIKGMSETGFEFNENIKSDMEELVEALLLWDVDEISIGGEELLNKIQTVTLWLEETDIKLGRCLVAMIPEEQTYIEYARQLFENYDNDAKTSFKRMLDNADKQAAKQKKNITEGSQKEKTTECFPTPDGTRWSDIKIQFRNGHTVTIWAGGQSGRYTYYQMGMYSKKNGDCTVQWKLLEAFANSRGEIDWRSPLATDKLKKQKQELSRRLREFFRLKEDPIEWVKGEKCYRCRFRILPEGADEY
ncbi:hypothetical protein [Desulfosarcina alkanivorans]|nr:hypothetical protein [Desulfosarcina alkanivorans]